MSETYVKVWEEAVTIPTYGVGPADKNPMFFEKRVYQGCSGVVYPYPIIEKIFDEKENKTYRGLYLENKYLKIMILPELGGRVQMAFDKVKERHFVYYNQVVKPALVGLCGPWISGGIEFNWPQHHRPSTFDPVDYTLAENTDGSKSVWVNEVERMSGTKGMAGFTLYPDKAYLEIKAQLYNRTPLPQTFLWWANPAVKVNDHYQSVFPPDVNAVFDHGKRDVSSFPIATGTYYKVDYAPGTDISRYKNIPVPTSYMAIRSDYDFVGGYEHDSQAGMLHVANHHVSPGKKQWTWGHGDFGRAWDRNLTDEDGPYIEIMTGVFTDNQPDFSWLMPYEEKSFTQYFLPYQELGLVKNANKDLLLNVDQAGDLVHLKVYATSDLRNLTLRFAVAGEEVLCETIAVSPEQVYAREVPVGPDRKEADFLLQITGASGRELIRYEPPKNQQNELPEPAKPALAPEEVTSAEQLFLTGQHLEQYRHATYSPVPYYEEALRRDPGDIRNNNAMGLWYLRRGKAAQAEPYFRRAVATLTQSNPNPYDGEPLYNLGLCLKLQGKEGEAYDAFYKATWSSAWQDSGYFSLAQLDAAKHEWRQGLEHINKALDRNACNSKAWALKATVLRKLDLLEEGLAAAREASKRDLFNLSAYFEQHLLCLRFGQTEEAATALATLKRLSRGQESNYAEYALDYAAAGLYDEAIGLLSQVVAADGATSPLTFYYLGYFCHKQGKQTEAQVWFQRAAAADPAYCFPNRLEDVTVLQKVLELNPADARAPYYLGNLWYDKRQYAEAIALWEQAAEKDAAFPTVFRNLGIAYYNKLQKPAQARTFLEHAFNLDPFDARILMELDQLYRRLRLPPADRLAFLEEHYEVASSRDDLYLERATLYFLLGNPSQAYDLIMSRQFHPWEGGEGKASGLYVASLVALAKERLEQNLWAQAVDLLQKAQTYPPNLGEGKLPGALENDIYYWLGCAYEGLGEMVLAQTSWRKATAGGSEPGVAMFYNDQQPDQIFYQGLAWGKLGNYKKAEGIFKRLLAYGQQHQDDETKLDYFAVSLPDLLVFEDDLRLRNRIHCYYLMGLGYLGMQMLPEAGQAFGEVLRLEAIHLGAFTHQALATASLRPEFLDDKHS